MKLKDKVAIVTGGSQGIGEAISLAYGREGAKVVILNRTLEKGQAVAQKIADNGGTATALKCDVSVRSDCQAAVQEIVKEFGTVDIIYNAAGVMINKAIEDYTEDDWDAMININLKGSFLMSQAVVPIMKEKGYGKIIFTASIAASTAFPMATPYCASKGGVLMLMKALSAEIAQFGVNVNAVSPGNTATPLNAHLQADSEFVELMASRTPTGRAYITTDEMAGAAVFLASEDSTAVHGLDLIVDDGWCAI